MYAPSRRQPKTKREALSMIDAQERIAATYRRDLSRDRTSPTENMIEQMCGRLDTVRYARAVARHESHAAELRALLPTLPE